MIENLPQVSGLIFAVGLAFVPEVRSLIFKRDRGVCQCGDCIGNYIIGKPLSFNTGFNMNCAHYPGMHKPYADKDPSNGRLISALEHMKEEVEMGNHKGAALLYENQTVMNVHWLKENGWRDLKPPLNMIYDWADGGEQAIVDYFREKL